MSWSLAESARLVEHEKHGNLFCGKSDGKRRKRPLPVLVFVRAQKGKSCEKGNINKRQILRGGKINLGTRNSEKHVNLFCGEQRKCPLPILVFVRGQKGNNYQSKS